ncbi:hypothetical protein [Microbacterium sp. C7(2022)]|uniref:hypothetical protein n=1 Tax=Microbacterium sp. C7(2022) TaxID=2992759 RepID=UPI00237BF765|nr:hypothetical protein [Microbacterium sp. C7(2022)]MDE0545078.1 hypothetical protein [Microbacterium sp. C7(2022)]
MTTEKRTLWQRLARRTPKPKPTHEEMRIAQEARRDAGRKGSAFGSPMQGNGFSNPY